MYRTLVFTLFHNSEAKQENHKIVTYKISTLYNTVGSWRQFRNNVEYAASTASCCQGPAQWLNEKLFSLVPCQHKISHRLTWRRCETPVCSSLRHTQEHCLRVPTSRQLFSLDALRLWETGMLNALVWLLCYLIWNFPHLKVWFIIYKTVSNSCESKRIVGQNSIRSTFQCS
jgi:hypothetical protein